MTAESEELLSSMVDGAGVDPDRLAAALEDPEAPRLLVDFARVRQAVEADLESPGETFAADVRRAIGRQPSLRTTGSRTPLAVLAAMILVAAATGVWVGRATAPVADVAFTALAACADPRGAAHRPGEITAIDGRRVRCVVKGEWVPIQ